MCTNVCMYSVLSLTNTVIIKIVFADWNKAKAK